MHQSHDIQYALETTKVLYEPDRRIETFNQTRFEFLLITELMDSVGKVRIRTGELEAQKPQIIRPEGFGGLELEGFTEKAQELFNWLSEQGADLSFLQYGFQMRRTTVNEETLHEPIEQVRARLVDQAKQEGAPNKALIEGVDDAWEVSVMKFALEMMMKSAQINQFDFKRKGLL